jgi:hypothetical protein
VAAALAREHMSAIADRALDTYLKGEPAQRPTPTPAVSTGETFPAVNTAGRGGEGRET